MRRDQQIQVNERLLEREELFLRIHNVENEVLRIMGGDYPFTVVELPSTRRGKRKASATRKADAGVSVDVTGSRDRATVTLRKLDAGEVGYRITYRQFTQTVVEEHVDFDAVRTLLACQSGQIEVQTLETINADGRVAEQLY